MDYIYISEKQVYEIDPEWGGVVVECHTDDEARVFAREYTAKWNKPIKLYRVPFINTSGSQSHDLWPDQVVEVPLD
jgi:hypothetical protein